MRTNSYRMPGRHVTDCSLDVPLDHNRPDGEQITIFARVVAAAGRAYDDLPFLLWLQGSRCTR